MEWTDIRLKMCVIEALEVIMNEKRPERVVKKSCQIEQTVSTVTPGKVYLVVKKFDAFHSLGSFSYLIIKEALFSSIRSIIYKMYFWIMIASRRGKIL